MFSNYGYVDRNEKCSQKELSMSFMTKRLVICYSNTFLMVVLISGVISLSSLISFKHNQKAELIQRENNNEHIKEKANTWKFSCVIFPQIVKFKKNNHFETYPRVSCTFVKQAFLYIYFFYNITVINSEFVSNWLTQKSLFYINRNLW